MAENIPIPDGYHQDTLIPGTMRLAAWQSGIAVMEPTKRYGFLWRQMTPGVYHHKTLPQKRFHFMKNHATN